MKTQLEKVGIHDPTFQLIRVEKLVKDGVLDKPLDGNHGEIHPKGGDFVESGVPFIMASDVRNGVVDFECCKFITVDHAATLRKGFARNGDVLVTHKATIGETAIVDYDKHPFVMLTPQVTYYRVLNDEILNNRFLRYYFDSQLFQETFKLWASSGSTRAYLGITKQQKLPIVVPPIEKQRKIAAIISPFDDSIELNKRRIALLENLAQEIYKEWFVRLRFPGYTNVETKKGVPSGWSFRELSTFADEVRNGVKREDMRDDELYVGLEHISRKSISLKHHATAESIGSNKLRFSERDILFCKIRPYLHKVALAHLSGACSTDTIVLKPTHHHYEAFLLFSVFSDTFIELATISAKGTKMPRADWGFLKKLELKVPDESLLREFQSDFDQIFDQIVSILRANQLLKESRDKLLHRLISGQLPVEGLDVGFTENMNSKERGLAERELDHA